jgi:aminotransferase
MSRFRSRRLRGLIQSDIRAMTRECDRVGGINLGQGLCDLPTPDLVVEGAIRAIRAGENSYSYAEGTPELRVAIARKLARDNALEFDPAREIVVTVGASGAFASAITALLDPGEGILIPEPYYGYHYNTALVAGLEPQVVAMRAPAFRIEETSLRSALRENTRAIVVCTPANPCGRMFDRHELELVASVAEERDLLVITDEVYEYIRFDGREHISPATVGGLATRTVTIGSFSKTFSITGWRVGFAAAPPEMAEAIRLVSDLYYVCAPTPLQLAVAAGLDGGAEHLERMPAMFERKRNRMCEALASAGLPPIVPEGSYYVLADVSGLGLSDSRSASLAVLERAGVASVPCRAFFQSDDGERYLRFCFAKSDEDLAEACRRLETRAVC